MIVVMRGTHLRLLSDGACGKRPYKTAAKAKKQLRSGAKARGCRGYYLCERCGTYHLTSQKGST